MDFTHKSIRPNLQALLTTKLISAGLLILAILTFVVFTFLKEPNQILSFPPAMMLMGLAVLFQLRKGMS